MSESPPQTKSELINLEEMQAAVEVSGYLLEGRIASLMAKRGFFVERNCFRPDPADDAKAIEIDAAGRYFEWVSETNKDIVTASLLVECKNNAQPVAFFTQRQQITELNDNRIQYGGFPSFSADPDTKVQVPLHKLLEAKGWHHYCQASEVATQFCGFARPKQKSEWKAEPMRHYSDSFTALARASAFALDSWSDLELQRPNIQVEVCYPILVFQGPIYCVEDAGGKAKLEPVEHLQLHHSASVNGRLILAQIDVVTEAAFPRQMETILEELVTFRDRIKGLYRRLQNSARDQKRVAAQDAARRRVAAALNRHAPNTLTNPSRRVARKRK